MMQVILSNSKHPEYGQATIPLPLVPGVPQTA